MRSNNFFVALFLCASLEGMHKHLSPVSRAQHLEICQSALKKIYALVDVYLESHENSSLALEDIRLEKPLLQQWCPPSQQGLILEIISRVQLQGNSLRYSVRTPWGLLPLIEAADVSDLPKPLFPDIHFSNSIKVTQIFEPYFDPERSNHYYSYKRFNRHMSVWEKEKCTIQEVAKICIPPIAEEHSAIILSPDALTSGSTSIVQ